MEVTHDLPYFQPNPTDMTLLPRRFRLVLPAVFLTAAGPGVLSLSAQSLAGSRASMDLQNRQARAHDFTFLRTPTQVRSFADNGYLVRIRSSGDFDLHAVSFPYARPEVETFVRRLGAQYRAACGEKLVVTSLTRPQSRQPSNASSRSVHPTGMAVDLRRSNKASCRRWLESVLVDLERAGVLEATRERYPPHYHVAVFPRAYAQHVERLASAAGGTARSADRVAASDEALEEYRVRRGDSLWTIARAYGTTVEDLRSQNDLSGSRIYAGQVLHVPVTGRR